MLYINDPKSPHYKYDDLVDIVIKFGIDPKRAYIYLASVGVKGVPGRVINDSGMDYLQPVKLAVKDNKLVIKVETCKHCQSVTVHN